ALPISPLSVWFTRTSPHFTTGRSARHTVMRSRRSSQAEGDAVAARIVRAADAASVDAYRPGMACELALRRNLRHLVPARRQLGEHRFAGVGFELEAVLAVGEGAAE